MATNSIVFPKWKKVEVSKVFRFMQKHAVAYLVNKRNVRSSNPPRAGCCNSICNNAFQLFSRKHMTFLMIIRNYFSLETLLFSDECNIEFYFALVFRKFAKQTKSAVIPRYEKCFILGLLINHPGAWYIFFILISTHPGIWGI